MATGERLALEQGEARYTARRWPCPFRDGWPARRSSRPIASAAASGRPWARNTAGPARSLMPAAGSGANRPLSVEATGSVRKVMAAAHPRWREHFARPAAPRLPPCQDNGSVATTTTPSRQDLVRKGRRLEYFTIGYNSAEGVVSIIAGLIAGSVSLIGFGLDSVIEVASGTALLWRLHQDLNRSRREQIERITLRIVGGCFLALGAYILYESSSRLIGHEAPERSIPGIIVAAAAVIVMPLLARAKRRVAAGIGSAAMSADSKQADFCTYLSAILLGGLLLNTLFGWWWADPGAGLAMVPIIAKEGIDGITGKACCNDCGAACH